MLETPCPDAATSNPNTLWKSTHSGIIARKVSCVNCIIAWFEGDPRWLEISVNGTTLTTRQQINPTPYSLRSLKPWQTAQSSGNDIAFTTNGLFGIGKVRIGDTTPLATLTVGDGDKFKSMARTVACGSRTATVASRFPT